MSMTYLKIIKNCKKMEKVSVQDTSKLIADSFSGVVISFDEEHYL